MKSAMNDSRLLSKKHWTILKEVMRESAVKANRPEFKGTQCTFPPVTSCRKAYHPTIETIKTVLPRFSSKVHLKNSSETQAIQLRFGTETRENEGQTSRRNRQSIWTEQRNRSENAAPLPAYTQAGSSTQRLRARAKGLADDGLCG